ncbi:MAG TPA: hypothetical protein VKX17_10270 [Planctomycetota bacterium]|nr:hypothetical protein [Planctomycetota bacterium]
MPAHDFSGIDSNIYHSLHVAWLSSMMKALNGGILPKPYYALVEQVQRAASPDLIALEKDGEELAASVSEAPAQYGTTLADLLKRMSPPKTAIVASAKEIMIPPKQRTITIRHSDGHHIVALVELMSRSNKVSLKTLDKFVDKICDALAHEIHVSIIDPFPPNRIAPRGIHGAIWSALGERAPVWNPAKPFSAAAYESSGEINAYVQPYGIGEALPDLPLFLKPSYYVYVPLEKTYTEALASMPDYWRDKIARIRPRKRSA